MNYCVPSMMHSGTHLLRFEILQERSQMYETKGWFHDIGPGQEVHEWDCIIGGHLVDNDGMMDRWEDCFKRFPIIVPLRHPARQWKSFAVRGKPKEKYNQQWRNLIDRTHHYGPLYIHVDAPEVRDAEVEALAKLVNRPCKTDWPVAQHTGSRKGNHDADITEDLLKEVPGEYIDFYFETMHGNAYQKSKCA